MIKIYDIIKLDKLKDKKYKSVTIFFNNGHNVCFYPRNIIKIEKVDNELDIVHVETSTYEYYFNMEDISVIDFRLDVSIDPLSHFNLTDSQKFIIDELKSKKNETIKFIFQDKDYIVVDPRDIKDIKFWNVDGTIAVNVIGNITTHLFIIDNVLRMEINKGEKIYG